MAKGHKAMLGVTVEPDLIKELDMFGGKVPRYRVVERALNQYLSAYTTIKNLQGPRIAPPTAHAATEVTPTTTTTATTDTGTPAADNFLSNMTTDEAPHLRGGVAADVNRKKVNSIV